MHGLRLMIKEEALIISDQPSFRAVAELAKRGLLSPETWLFFSSGVADYALRLGPYMRISCHR